MLLILVVAFLASCRTATVSNELAALSGSIARGARDTLTSEQARAAYARALDTLLVLSGRRGGEVAAALRDTIAGAKARALVGELVRSILTDAQRGSDSLRDGVLGARTSALLVRIVAQLRDEVIGGRTRALVGELRSELTGPATLDFAAALRDTLTGEGARRNVAAVAGDVAGLAESISSKLVARITGAVDAQREGATGNVTLVIGVAGAIVAALMVIGGIVWARARRYARMLGVVTHSVQAMPDAEAREQLKRHVSTAAIAGGVAGHLRVFLAGEGLLSGASEGAA